MKAAKQNIRITWKYEGLFRHKLFVVLMLALSYSLGVWLRSLYGFPELRVLTYDDPYVQLRYAEYLVEKGYLPVNDTLRYYPEGFNPNQELLLVPWFVACFSRLTGLQPLDVAIWLPAFFASLIVVPAYFIGKMVTGSRVSGVIAAFLAASAPAFVSRSFAGFCDKEAFTTPLMFAGLALALASFNATLKDSAELSKRSLATSIFLALASGILIGASALGWTGFLFTYLVLAAYALLMLLFSENEKSLSSISIPYLAIFAVSGAFAALLTPRYGGLAFLTSIKFLAPASLFLLLMALRWLRRKQALLLMLVLGVVVVIANWSYVVEQLLWLLGHKGLVRPTVAESQPTDPLWLWNFVGFPLIVAIPALLPRSLRGLESKSNYFFVLSSFVISLVLAISERRLLMFLSLSVSIVAGIALSWAINHFASKLFIKRKKRLELDRKALQNLAFSILMVILVIVSTFALPTYKSESGQICRHIDAYASSFEHYRFVMSRWLEALNWLRENSSSDAVVISWWDYGYIIQYYANRTTVVDPGNFYEWRNIAVAKFFMSEDDEEALRILKESFGLEGKEVYVIVSGEELYFFKSNAMAVIAGTQIPLTLGREGIVILRPNVLVLRLLSGMNVERFELAFHNDWVVVYRVLWSGASELPS